MDGEGDGCVERLMGGIKKNSAAFVSGIITPCDREIILLMPRQ